MTVLVRDIPQKVLETTATAFKVFIPQQLNAEQARPVWEALEAHPDIILGDPFALPGVSTVFPGVSYAVDGLLTVAALVQPVQDEFPTELADAWVEVWAPDGYEDPVEALDVTDLTQPQA